MSMAILFCSATCCPGLLGGAEEKAEGEEEGVEVMPKGGDRAPRASFSRNTSLDSSVICAQGKTSVLLSRPGWMEGVGRGVSHLAVLLLDQALGLLNVLV